MGSSATTSPIGCVAVVVVCSLVWRVEECVVVVRPFGATPATATNTRSKSRLWMVLEWLLLRLDGMQ